MKKILSLFAMAWPFLIIAQPIGIIPQPVSIQLKNGSFLVDNNTSINYDPANRDLKAAAEYFSSYVSTVSGISLPVNKGKAKKIEFMTIKVEL